MTIWLNDFLWLDRKKKELRQKGKYYRKTYPRKSYNDFIENLWLISLEEGLREIRIKTEIHDFEARKPRAPQTLQVTSKTLLDHLGRTGVWRELQVIDMNVIVNQAYGGDTDYMTMFGPLEQKGPRYRLVYPKKFTVIFSAYYLRKDGTYYNGKLIVNGKVYRARIELLRAEVPKKEDIQRAFPIGFWKEYRKLV